MENIKKCSSRPAIRWALTTHEPRRTRNSMPTTARGENGHPPQLVYPPPCPREGCSAAPHSARLMRNVDSMANGDVEASAESPEADEQHAVPTNFPAATKGRGLRRWRRIRGEKQSEGDTTAGGGDASCGGGGNGRRDEESAQLHKRRNPVPADAPKAKHVEAAPAEEESSTASVESRFVPQPPAKLDGFLAESAGFSIGADSDSSEDRSSRSSTTGAVFPRRGHDAALVPRSRASLQGKHPRAARSRADRLRVHAAAGSIEAENSRTSVESGLRSSNGTKASHVCVGITGNGVRKGRSASGGGHSGEGRQSEEVRSSGARGYYEENGSSVLGMLAQRSADSDEDHVKDTLDEGSVRNGGLHSGGDAYAESVSLLQKTQEALENEIEKLVAVGKVRSDEFDISDDEGSGSVHLEEPIEELSEKIKHLMSRLQESSALMKEKDSRILELEALSRNQTQPGRTATSSTINQLSQSELEELHQEKIRAEIQCTILTRACETLATLADDQTALHELQQSLSEDYKRLGIKLRRAQTRAITLEAKAEKLQVQSEELSGSSEVLHLQSKAGRVSLFCFVQFMLLCVALGTCLTRLVPGGSTEVVPT